jgi:hypothetical protein
MRHTGRIQKGQFACRQRNFECMPRPPATSWRALCGPSPPGRIGLRRSDPAGGKLKQLSLAQETGIAVRRRLPALDQAHFASPSFIPIRTQEHWI